MSSSVNAPAPAKDYPRWARTVRKDRLPARMGEHLQGVEEFFDHYAASVETWRRRNTGYHSVISSLCGFYIPPGARVLEIGSGTGDLLAATTPRRGIGIDISGEMVRLAASKHPDLEFRCMSAEHLDLRGESFDYIILSDLVGFLYHIRLVFIVCGRCATRKPGSSFTGTACCGSRSSRLRRRPGLSIRAHPELDNQGRPRQSALSRGLRSPAESSSCSVAFASSADKLLCQPFSGPLPVIRYFALTNWIVARPMRLAEGAARRRYP